MNEHAPGYYAVIPAPIRYDDKIPANAKLLYGEISALIGPEGYCYATNTYFAGLYKLSDRTIRGLISDLQDNGYIVVKMERSADGKIQRRRLYLSVSTVDGQPEENIFLPPGKNLPDPPEKFFQYTNTSNTNIERDNKKGDLPPTDSKPPVDKAQRLFLQWLGSIGSHWPSEQRTEIEDAFTGFVEMRQKRKRPLSTERAVKLFCKNLAELSQGDPREMVKLIDYAIERNWMTVYPITGGSKPAAPKKTGGRVYECL